MKTFFQTCIVLIVVFFCSCIIVQAQKPILMIQAGTGAARNISYSPDETKLFTTTGGTEKTGILWDISSGKQLHIFKNIMAGTFTKDGKALIVFADNKIFKSVDFMGSEIKLLSQTPTAVFFNSGTIYPEQGVMFTDDKLINIYTGNITVIKADGFRSRDYGGIRNIVAMGGESGKVTICNSKTGQPTNTLTIPVNRSFDYATSLSFSKDNNLLLSATSGAEGMISIFSFVKNDFINKFTYSYPITAACLSPDGKSFIILGNKITLVDTKTGRTVWEKENTNSFRSAFFNENGTKALYSAASALAILKNDRGTVLKDFKILPPDNIQGSFKLTDNDLKLIYGPSENKVVQWDFLKSAIAEPYNVNQEMSFSLPSPDGNKVYTILEKGEKKSLIEYDLAGNIQPFIYSYIGNISGTKRLSISYDSKYILLSTADEFTNMLNIWNTSSHENLAIGLSYDHPVTAFANKTNTLAAINNQNKDAKSKPVEFYEIPSGKMLKTITFETVGFDGNSLQYSSTDKYLLARQRNNLSLIDIKNESIQTIPNPDSNLIGQAYSFTPDDKYFVRGTDNGMVEFFDIATKQWVSSKTIAAHKQRITGIQYSINGKFMYTASMDRSINIWNTDTKELLATLYSFTKTNDWAVITPDGHFDATPGAQDNMYYVKNANILALGDMYEKFFTPHLLLRILNGEKINREDIVIDNVHDKPTVKIQYAEQLRNLEVGDDDVVVYSNTTGLANITVDAIAKDDKIDEIRLFHNGKVVNLATRGLFVTDADGIERKKYSINLLPGNNSFRAIALNSQRTESDPVNLTVSYSANGSQPSPTPKTIANNNTVTISFIDKTATMYLMVVGINAYTNKINPLTYALPDATSFKDEIEKDAKTVLANVKTYFIADAKANREGIINAFNEIKKEAKPEDVFVFYYAGHGYINPSNKEFYLVSADVADGGESLLKNGIPAKDLQQYAVDIQAQKQLFILDACQSAGAFDAMLKHDGEQQKSLAVVARSTGTHWMAASGSTETAKEFGELGHGAFTYVLLQALKGQAAANKMITVNGMKNFLQVQVPELVKKYGSNNQYPASYGFGNDFPVEIVK